MLPPDFRDDCNAMLRPIRAKIGTAMITLACIKHARYRRGVFTETERGVTALAILIALGLVIHFWLMPPP